LSIAKDIRYRFIEELFGKKVNIKMREFHPGNVSVTYADDTKVEGLPKYQRKVNKEGIFFKKEPNRLPFSEQPFPYFKRPTKKASKN
jgi:hypothetical protein